jgi:SNF family Na+-dependent transporter
MAAVGSAVGLGNIWRFPFIAFKSGGGAFLVPYFAAILVAGIPILILEYGIGQRYQAGAPTALAKIHPWFRWVGWFAMLVGLSISFYYCVIMAYSWKYMFNSVTMSWQQPTSNSDILKIAYLERTGDSDSELSDLREQGAKKRKDVSGGCCVEYIKKSDIDNYTNVLKQQYGENTVIFRTKEEILDFARSYLKSPPAKDADIVPHVAFMHIDNMIECSQALDAFYASVDNARLHQFLESNPEINIDNLTVQILPPKLKPDTFREKVKTAVKEIDAEFIKAAEKKKTEKKEETVRSILENAGVEPLTQAELKELGVEISGDNEFFKLGGSRKVTLISEKDNVTNYRNKEVLGGFSAGLWMGDHARNQTIEKQVKIMKDQKFSIDQLDGKMIVNTSPAALKAYYKLSEDIRQHVPNERLEAGKESLIAALRTLKVSHTADIFTPVWGLVFWAFVTWLCIFLIIFKGVHSVGKVVMFTVPGPIIILIILIIHGLFQEGASTGIRFFLNPNWTMLKDWKVWSAAFGQIFFSLSLGFGIMIAYASYQPKDSDISNNAFMTTFCNCATSFFGAFAVFSVLGYLAVVTNSGVSDVVDSGPGLVFVTYPLALMKMGMAGRVLGFLFFLCLLMLGIDSAFSIVEAVITGVHDTYKKISRELLTVIICGVGFLFSCLYCFRSGLIWLDIVDHWVSDGALMFSGLLECIAISYFVKNGLSDMRDHINKRSEINLGYWWDTFIKYVIPAILTVILGMKFIADAETSYSGYDALYSWANVLVGWGYFIVLFLVAFSIAKNWIALVALAGAAVLMLLLYTGLRSLAPAAMGAIGFMFLFGGFAWCLKRAMAGKKPEETAETAQ